MLLILYWGAKTLWPLMSSTSLVHWGLLSTRPLVPVGSGSDTDPLSPVSCEMDTQRIWLVPAHPPGFLLWSVSVGAHHCWPAAPHEPWSSNILRPSCLPQVFTTANVSHICNIDYTIVNCSSPMNSIFPRAWHVPLSCDDHLIIVWS